MNLQSLLKVQKLSKVQKSIDVMTERIYDMKESLVENSIYKDELETMYKLGVNELIIVLTDSIRPAKRKTPTIVQKEIGLTKLFELVCECSCFSKETLLETAKSRCRKFVLPRQVHMAFRHMTFELSDTLSSSIYQKDKGTCLHAAKVIRDLYDTDKLFVHKYQPVFDFCMEFDRTLTNAYLNK